MDLAALQTIGGPLICTFALRSAAMLVSILKGEKVTTQILRNTTK